jgi:hypothetical protein
VRSACAAEARTVKIRSHRADAPGVGRLFGIAAVVLAVWAAAEIYTRGIDAAFGGVLKGLGDPVVPLSELHSGGGRGAGPPGRARAEREDFDDPSDPLVVDEPDPFAPRPTPITRLGAHVQGEIDGAYQERYGDR